MIPFFKAIKADALGEDNHQIVFRPAIRGDLQAIFALVDEAEKVEERPLIATIEAIEEHAFGNEPRCAFLVADWAGKLAGFAMYYPGYDFHSASWGHHLSYIVVTESCRHRGIAKALIREVEMLTGEAGGAWVSWTIPSHYRFAQRMYRSLKHSDMPADFMSMAVTSFRKL